jgi:hypothetical protein
MFSCLGTKPWSDLIYHIQHKVGAACHRSRKSWVEKQLFYFNLQSLFMINYWLGEEHRIYLNVVVDCDSIHTTFLFTL